jgi:hypothetical protein
MDNAKLNAQQDFSDSVIFVVHVQLIAIDVLNQILAKNVPIHFMSTKVFVTAHVPLIFSRIKLLKLAISVATNVKTAQRVHLA